MRRLEFQISEVFTNIRRNGILSLAAVLTVLASLAILSLFFLMQRNLQGLLEEQTRKAQISAFLKPGLSEAEQQALREQITAIAGVAQVEYVSPQAALARTIESMDLSAAERKLLGPENRLPAKFAVHPADPAGIESVAEQLQKLAGVQDVRYGEKVVAPLNELQRRFRQWGWGALVVLSLATCGIISNAIRLTIYARRREIRIMQLVGATDGFIRMPFLLEGLVHGIVGGLLALLTTSVLYAQVREASAVIIPWLKLISLEELMPSFGIGLVALGMLFGFGSSLVSIRQFLREA
ncbi:MAG: ABC transporter permease [Fimbriimonadaceae bacterium]|nr:ABC transporter permease [Fimbriimonadaceae bacterium]